MHLLYGTAMYSLSSHSVIQRRLYLLTMQKSKKLNKVSLSWIDVLLPAQRTECTLPCDRVYAVMGLLQKRWRLQPDYNITHWRLLRNVLEGEIASARETCILS
jgi:hypothetical protein